MATQTKAQTQAPQKEHHYLRSFFSSVFAIFGISLLISSIFAFWLDTTLTNTNQFVAIVGPLVTKPEVQDFVVTKASQALLDNGDAPIRDISQQLLGDEAIANKTDEQLKAEITPIIQENLKTVISSAAFANLWETSLKSVHSQLISQLSSNSPTMQLNLHPVIVGAIDQLSNTRLSFIKDKLEIKDDVGVITIKDDQLATMRKFYNYFKQSVIILIVTALIFLGLSVAVAAHRLNTLRRLLIIIGVIAALYAVALTLVPNLKIGSATDVEQQKFIVVMFSSITDKLRLALVVIAAACAATVAASIFLPKALKKKP